MKMLPQSPALTQFVCTFVALVSLSVLGCQTTPATKSGMIADEITPPPEEIPAVGTKTDHDDAYWRARLTPKQFDIVRNHDTEYPRTGVYDKHEGVGTYHCSACNAPLYESSTKFDSGTGWPSYYAAIEGRVKRNEDRSIPGMPRVSLECAHCDGHLGHVFRDGPPPTGERHCINSHSLYFRPE